MIHEIPFTTMHYSLGTVAVKLTGRKGQKVSFSIYIQIIKNIRWPSGFKFYARFPQPHNLQWYIDSNSASEWVLEWVIHLLY